jgi:hypothetical protein
MQLKINFNRFEILIIGSKEIQVKPHLAKHGLTDPNLAKPS